MKKWIITMIFMLYGFTFSQVDLNKRVDRERESKLNYQIGDQVKDFKIESLFGDEEISLSELKGKKVVVNFTTTWCPDCISEKIILNEDYKKNYLNKEDIKFIIVFGPYARDNRELAIKYMEDNNFSFPAYYDNDKKLSKIFGVKNIPATFLINEEGILEDVNIESGYKQMDFFKNK